MAWPSLIGTAESAEQNLKTEDRGQQSVVRSPFSVLRCAVSAFSGVGFYLLSFRAEDFQRVFNDRQRSGRDLGVVNVAGYLYPDYRLAETFGQRLHNRRLGGGKPFAASSKNQIHIVTGQVHPAGAAKSYRLAG